MLTISHSFIGQKGRASGIRGCTQPRSILVQARGHASPNSRDGPLTESCLLHFSFFTLLSSFQLQPFLSLALSGASLLVILIIFLDVDLRAGEMGLDAEQEKCKTWSRVRVTQRSLVPKAVVSSGR